MGAKRVIWTADELEQLLGEIHYVNEYGGSMRTIADAMGKTEMQVRIAVKRYPNIRRLYNPKKVTKVDDIQRWPREVDGFKLVPFAGSDR